MNIRRGYVMLFVFAIISVFVINPVLADPSQETSETQGGFHLGFSPYTGVIGAELQRGKYSLTLGIPASIGLRYYFNEQPKSWFLGAHAMYYELDKEETIDHIEYDEQKATLAGLGIGHKWRYKDHWDLVLSMSLVYNKEEFKNDIVKRTEESIGALPGITIGYSF